MKKSEPYPILQIPKDAHDISEPLGTKSKFWYENEKYLFKIGRPGTGENWAEIVASEFENLLKLPCVKYEFASYEGEMGVTCPNFVPKGGRLVHGNELLAQIDETYPVSQFYGAKPYTITAVINAIEQEKAEIPLLSNPLQDIKSGADVFIGYLLLDTWIANQDRHDQNWGIIYIEGNPSAYLTPTFDHASSLGRNESDVRRKELLESKDIKRNIENYIQKARSPFYNCNEPPKRLKTIDASLEAALIKPKAALRWLSQLSNIRDIDMVDIMHRVPKSEISKEGIDFAIAILKLNRKRLLELRGGLK